MNRPTTATTTEEKRMTELFDDGGNVLESNDCECVKPCLKFKKKQRVLG